MENKKQEQELLEIRNIAKTLKQLDLDITNNIDRDSLALVAKEKRQLTIKLITKCSRLS